jgi:hypothetical protein
MKHTTRLQENITGVPPESSWTGSARRHGGLETQNLSVVTASNTRVSVKKWAQAVLRELSGEANTVIADERLGLRRWDWRAASGYEIANRRGR